MSIEPTIRPNPSPSADSKAILALVDDWSRALETRDTARLVANYAPEVVLFAGIPPFRTVGADGVRAIWDACLPHFPERFRSEHRDLSVVVDGDVAFLFGLHRFIPTPAEHPCGSTWMRVTVGFRRIAGQWRVVHEHASIPFNPLTDQAVPITDPDEADLTPDPWGGAPVGVNHAIRQ